MSTVNRSTSSSASSIRGYGGLVSGLDRDTLIENMTAGTRSKIAKQKQQKQIFQWKQEAYRSISSKLVEFSRKYMSYSNQSTNLSSSSFWAKSSITTEGANSKYISATGSSSLADSVSIVGVKQMAKDATMTSTTNVSDQLLETGTINFSGTEPVSTIEGGYLSFKYGTKTYSVSLSSGTSSDGFTYDYSNGAKAEESITHALKKVSIGSGKTLADVIDVTANPSNELDPAGTDFQLDIKSTDTAGNTLMLYGGSTAALKAIGFSDFSSLSDSSKTITSSGLGATRLGNQDFFEDKTFEERVSGKRISFTYNGTTKSIELGQNLDDITKLKDDIQQKLDKEFGTNRIKVGNDGDKLTFKTWNPSTNAEDTSSILSITTADTGVIGKNGALKVAYGESNRLNLTASLAESGLNGISTEIQTRLTTFETNHGGAAYDTTYFAGSVKTLDIIKDLGSDISDTTTISDLKDLIASKYSNLSDTVLSGVNEAIEHFKSTGSTNVGELKTAMNTYVGDRELKLTINNTKIEGLSYNSTINDIIEKVNDSDAGVTMSYMKNADKFSIISTAGGAAGKVDILGDDATMLFGTKDTNYSVSSGQDAIVGVQYEGSSEVIEMVRGNNSFDLDGLNITLNGTFGYDAGGNRIAGTEAVTFNAKADSEKIISAVKDMVKDYNEIIDLVNDEVSTKRNREYSPLTDDQKADMTEDQIEKWNDKAKKGMLFNDSDLRGLSDNLRFLLDSGSEAKAMLEKFGLSTSSTYGDNGKLVLNETDFKAALETNAEDLQKLFTQKEDATTGEKGGVMAHLNEITEKYASTTGATKGILIERAGSTYAPTSVLSNSLQKSIDGFDDYVKTLNKKLKTEQDRYIKQFTNLETVISQMNSQSSYLSSLSGS